MSWVYSFFFRVADWDLWARLTVGKVFFQTGRVLHHDFLSYTEKKPMWIDHEWGSGVVFYFLADHFGDIGLFVFKALSCFIVLFLISKIIEMQNPKPNAHLNILFYFIAFLSMFNGLGGTVRCQAFTFMFFTLWIYILERVRRNNENRLLWILPATSVIWANLHGGFVAGLGLIAMYGIGEFLNGKKFAKYFLTLIPATLVTLINPYGISYLYYVLDAVTMKRPTIMEWRNSFIGWPILKWYTYKVFVAISVITVAFNFIKNKFDYKNLDKVKYILLLVTLYLSIKHIKHQAFFGIVGCAFLYHDFYAIFTRMAEFLKEKFSFITDKVFEKLKMVKDVVVYTILIMIGGFVSVSNPVYINVDESHYPVKAIEFVKRNNISGNLLTVFHWGSYAAWKLYPQCLLAIDGRYEEVFPEKINILTDNFMRQADKNWYDFVKMYHTDVIITSAHSKAFLGLQTTKDWKLVYYDQTSGVFVPANKAKKHYIQPDVDQDYINKTKFDTDIDFSGKK